MASKLTSSSTKTITRRTVLQAGIGTLAALSTSSLEGAWGQREFRCIFLHLVGGPSHLDTWDPKPEAPSEYRGPFEAISTKVPGIQISELFPKMSRITDRIAFVRSVFHDQAPIHETGQQLIQTGNKQTGILIPGPIENTGVQLSHGQDRLMSLETSQRLLLEREPLKLREAYGQHEFGRSCLLARQACEHGARFVTVNMFRTVYDNLSWDCHADGASLHTNLNDYRNHVAPMFDATYSALLLDLEDRGMLETTLVVAAGEFGRSPKINLRGGRDHWTDAWTILFAGGGVRGGQVIGCTDRLGMHPVERPVHASAIANTILHASGNQPVVAHRFGEPLTELFSRSKVSS